MENNKENRTNILRKQFAEYGKTCWLICTCFKDGSEELYELPVNGYRNVAKTYADEFRKNHKGFCVCTVSYGDAVENKCFGI